MRFTQSLLRFRPQRYQSAEKGRARRERIPVWEATSGVPDSGAKRKIVIVGQSHMGALSLAARSLTEDKEFPPGLTMTFLQMRNPAYTPNLMPRGTRLNPALAKDIQKHSDGAQLVVSCLGGNAHAVMGLLEHPRAYDFVLDIDPTIPLEIGREIVPGALMRAALKKRMEETLTSLALIRAVLKSPLVHCQSPPPIAKEAHIREYPGRFVERMAGLGVAPGRLRLKLWKLQSDIFQTFCVEHDIGFLPAPSEAIDENGMLAEKAWGQDPTHGNSWYGGCVINQIREYMDTSAQKKDVVASV